MAMRHPVLRLLMIDRKHCMWQRDSLMIEYVQWVLPRIRRHHVLGWMDGWMDLDILINVDSRYV